MRPFILYPHYTVYCCHLRLIALLRNSDIKSRLSFV